MSGINRRQLLMGGAAALAAGALPWWKRLALAQDAPSQNLVLVFVQGGWDITVALDPKPGLTSIDSPAGDVKLFRGMPILTGDDRPAVGQFFESYGDVCALVNGVEVRSIAHEECTKRILTGTNSATKPDLGAITGVENGSDLAVPYMILGNTAFAGEYGGSTGRAGVNGQFITLLHPDASYTKNPAFATDWTRFEPTAREEDLITNHLKGRAERDKTRRGEHGFNKRRLDDFHRSVQNRHRLRPLLGSLDDFSSQLEFLPQIDLAVKVLKDGISRSVLIEHPGEWDTHSNNDLQQIPLHQDLFGGLQVLMNRLMQERLFENTTVVVLSEMSRTPKLNGTMGKDHWPVTSAMVLSPGVVGGQVFGGTDEYQNAVATNMLTGKRDANASHGVTSANFAAGILTLMGVDAEPYFPGIEPLRGIIRS